MDPDIRSIHTGTKQDKILLTAYDVVLYLCNPARS